MGWSLSDLGVAGGTTAITVLGVVPSLIIVGLVFVIGAVALYVLGLVSAVIYTLAGVGVLWFASLFGVFKSLWAYPAAALFLVIAFLWGWGTDHIKLLTMLAPAQFISSNPTVTVGQMSLEGKTVAFIMTPQVFGGILVFVGAVILAAVIVLKEKKKHRR